MVSVGVQHDKITHPVWLVRRFNFYGSAFFLFLLAIVVDFIAEDKGRPATNRPLMESVGAQMQARIPCVFMIRECSNA